VGNAGSYSANSKTAWPCQIGFSGLGIRLAGLNSAAEYVADFIHPEHHQAIGRIKDIAAGAVFIASVATVIAAIVIYFPKVF